MTCEHAFTFSLFALRNKDERTGAIITGASARERTEVWERRRQMIYCSTLAHSGFTHIGEKGNEF